MVERLMFTFDDGETEADFEARCQAAYAVAGAEFDDSANVTNEQALIINKELYGYDLPQHGFRANTVDAAELLWIPMKPMSIIAAFIRKLQGPGLLGQDITNLMASIQRTALETDDDLFREHFDSEDGPCGPVRMDDFVGVSMCLAAYAKAFMGAEATPENSFELVILSSAIESINDIVKSQADEIVARLLAEGKLTDEDIRVGEARADEFKADFEGFFGGESNVS